MLGVRRYSHPAHRRSKQTFLSLGCSKKGVEEKVKKDPSLKKERAWETTPQYGPPITARLSDQERAEALFRPTQVDD